MIRRVPGGLKLLIGAGAVGVVIPAVISAIGPSSPGNNFSKGTIDLTAAPETAAVAFAGMMPGDAVTNPIVISNRGTIPLRYSVNSAATNNDGKGLKDQMVLRVKTVDVTTPASACDNFDGRQLYTGDLDSTAGRIIGDPAQGQHGVGENGGDRVLDATNSETLCFRVSLPRETGNAFQAATTTVTFTFYAEQLEST